MSVHPDQTSLLHAALHRARMFRLRGSMQAARHELAGGIALARQLKIKAREAQLCTEAASFEEGMGRYKAALQHLKRACALNDAMAHERAQRGAAALALRLDTELAIRQAAESRCRAAELSEANRLLQDQAEILRQAAFLDALTGVGNRRYLDQHVQALFVACRNAERPLNVALLDVDHFKCINDTFSHAAGDEVLRVLGQIIKSQCRVVDICGRYGGEEFLLVFPDIDFNTALAVCDRLRRAVQSYCWASIDARIAATVSVGLACVEDAQNLQDVLARADQHLYEAKAAGRNRVVGKQSTTANCRMSSISSKAPSWR